MCVYKSKSGKRFKRVNFISNVAPSRGSIYWQGLTEMFLSGILYWYSSAVDHSKLPCDIIKCVELIQDNSSKHFALYNDYFMNYIQYRVSWKSLRPIRNKHCFANDTFKCISLNENVLLSTEISLTLFSKGAINGILVLVQRIAWRRQCDKPFSETIGIILLTHICVTRPQWIKPP